MPGGGLLDGSPTGVLAEIERGAIPAALARCTRAGVAIASVCTGALLLGAAGLLAGRPATTNRLALDRLRETGAEVIDERVVDDGDILTAQGVTAGMDLALWLVERERGRGVRGRAGAGGGVRADGERVAARRSRRVAVCAARWRALSTPRRASRDPR